MTNVKSTLFMLFLVTSSLMANDKVLLDKSLENLLNTDIQTKVQVGSRADAKDYLQSNAPVDVITLRQIQSSGVTQLTDLLDYYIAGFSTARSSISDGMDHIVNYSLRGMKADQILVLINGKRYHPSSLVSTSSGSSFVDLNSIPLIAINRVEVLRDGAAAQYGSDAIAGVINIILKSNDDNMLSLHTGVRKEGDGQNTQVDSFVSVPLEYDGFFNVAIMAKNENSTSRAGLDRRVNPPAQTTHFGLPDAKTLAVVLNSEVISKENTVFYSNLIANYKESEASTFYRTPDSSRAIYPKGFLPMLKDTILDYSFTLGAKGRFRDSTTWDISNVYGYNSSDFSLRDSMNYDLNASSPTSFDNGKLAIIQNTTDLNLKKSIKNIVLSGGLEYRNEKYTIDSGDTASYYGTGSQGFPGYNPSNEVRASRNSYALYLDTLYNVSSAFSTDLALRYEDFSDFGDTTNYKLAAKYKLTPKLLLRATTSSGFRAPSIAQNNYSYTSSALTNNILYKKGIFQPSHPASKAMGATNLKPEKSMHYSLGMVFQPNKQSSLMIDSFLVRVKDRILLSEKQNAITPTQIAVFNQYNISTIQYFKNIADIENYGIDIKYNQKYTFENYSELDSTLWLNYSQSKVLNPEDLSVTLVQDLENRLPSEYAKLLNVYKISDFTTTLNLNYYGSYQIMTRSTPSTFDSELTVDLDMNYAFTRNISFSIGGFNILDAMPNKWSYSGKYKGYDGIIQYPNAGPIGFSGAYYYISMEYKF